MPRKGTAGGIAALGVGGVYPGAGGVAGPPAHFIDLFDDTPLTALNAHSADVGTGAWAYFVGTFQIQALGINVENVPNAAAAWYDTGQVCRRLQCDWRNILDAALIRIYFRVSDVNNLYFLDIFTFGDTYWLTKKVAGVVTPLAQAVPGPTINNQAWYTAWVTDDGNEINIYHAAQGVAKPGSPIITHSDTALAANTGVGFQGFQAQQRWDNFYAWPSLVGDWA